MFVESYWTYHIQTLMGGAFRFQGWPVPAPAPTLAPPLADTHKQTDRERWIVNSRGSESHEAEKCASDVNSQASARAEINSAALPFPTGTHAAQIRWLCAVMNLPENLIWRGQRRVPAACEKLRYAWKSHGTPRSEMIKILRTATYRPTSSTAHLSWHVEPGC